MSTPPLDDDLAQEVVDTLRRCGDNQSEAARAMGLSRQTFRSRLEVAARRGLLGFSPVLPGFSVSRVSSGPKGDFIQQRPDHGPVFEMPATHQLGKMTVQRDAEGRVVQDWIRVSPDEAARDAAMRFAIEAMKEDLPRVTPTSRPDYVEADLCNVYVVNDSHFGMLSWREETGADYDLKIAEQTLLDWFARAIKLSPDAHTGIFAQLGDLLHHDSLESVTPQHRHVLDADSRLQKIIRIVIRTIRRIVGMLLEKHAYVHIIMAEGNHDLASSAWLREMMAAMYEQEPRITVDISPMPYYAFEWGKTALFFHHGHRRGMKDVDAVFAAEFREMFGRTTHAYAHLGHKHNDQMRASNLMKIEQHETLAARDAYASGGGWQSGRTAKVITYSKAGGEVFRNIVPARLVQP